MSGVRWVLTASRVMGVVTTPKTGIPGTANGSTWTKGLTDYNSFTRLFLFLTVIASRAAIFHESLKIALSTRSLSFPTDPTGISANYERSVEVVNECGGRGVVAG